MSVDIGADFGGGGVVILDGRVIKSTTNNMWWAGNWNRNNELDFTVSLNKGSHYIHIYGQEDCCDGASAIRFNKNGGSWHNLNVANLRTQFLTDGNVTNVVGSQWLRIVKNKLVKTFKMSSNYQVEFTIRPLGRLSGWTNILHATLDNTNCCSAKSRVPGIWFYSNTTKLHIRTSTNSSGNFGHDPNVQLPVNQDTTVLIKVLKNKLTVV